ncbi:MAG: PDZ domain-containing protein [Isosphaeraceae bacterium]
MIRIVRGFLILGLTAISTTGAARAAEPDGGLPRAGFFGAGVSPLTDEARAAQKLEEGVGVLVRRVDPGTAAAEAGLQVGDVITEVDGTKIDGAPRYVAKLGRRKTGETVKIGFVHEGKAVTKEAVLKPRPREKNTERHEVIFDAVSSRGGRLRTLVTRPKGFEGKRPALFVIQGLGGFSVEGIPGNPPLYNQIIDAFSQKGFVTFRVEKPGQGDSEGGPTQDVDFETELDGYRQGLKALKAYEFVDADNILIFGHSMGGIMGPLVAAESPVKGVAAYGTASKTWYEYLLENTRRQMALGGASAADIDDGLRKDSVINYQVFLEGKNPDDVAKANPALADRVREMFQAGRYYSGRNHGFFRQLSAKNMPAAWEKFGGHALAIWGKADFVSTEADHALIAETVNRARPGQGTFLALEGIDHGFNRADTQAESFAAMGKTGEFNPLIVTTLTDWAEKVTGGKPSSK